MTQSNLNGGLELLDRGDADVITLVEHAARILHVDLHQSEPGSTQSSKPNALASNYGFREQWVLRWLIRKVASELQAVGRRDQPATAQSFLLDLRLWKILLHVLRSTPDHVCAEIIAERKLSQCLDQVIQYVLLHLDAESQSIAQQETSILSRCDEEGHQVKRQRLSPDVYPTLRNEQEHFGLAVWILAVCCRVAAAIKPPPDTQKDAGSTEIAPWTLTTRDNASMLGTALHLLLALLRQRPQNSVSFDLNASATQLLSFWQSRLITASESAKTEEVSVFAVHCLRPCLELITQLQERKSGPKYRETRVHLEKLVALNVVLPLRKRFFERHAKSWKSQGDHLTWMEIRKVYNDFMNIIEPSHSATLRETKMLQVKWAAFTPAIYGIALRLLLKAELQKKQNEQPWLDALLAFLSYAACPLLAKLTLSAKKNVEVLDLAYPSDLHDSVVAIQSLLETANDLNSRPSLSVLGYLTCAILSWTSDGALWNLLAQLVKLDADVLVSNSGLPTSGFALNAFLENVETAAITLVNYHVLRDQIMIPLLKGYARSRALRSFVDVWLRYLQEALRRSCAGLPKTEKVIAVFVWQDEDMFDELIEMVKRHGTAALAQSSLSRLHESLKEIIGRAGSTLDAFAEIACTASIMEAMAMDSNQQVNELYDIQEVVISALNKRTDYQGQRWRLWKLLRVLQQKAPRDDIFQHIMSLEDPLVISLSRISEFLKEAQVDNISVAVYRECLERFSLIAAAAKTGKEPWVEEFKRDIDGLQNIMTSDQAVFTNRPQKVWNGRLEDLDGPLKLVWGCLCVALTHPTLLKMTPDFVLTARRMAGAIVEDPARARRMEKAIEEVQDMNGAQASDADSWMSIEGSGLVTASALARLREDVASGRLKRSRLRALGDKMFTVLNEHAGEMAMESLVNLLAAMDHLSSFAMVSFTRAHSWAEWLQVLELLERSKMQKASRMHLNAVQSLKRILARAWAHYHENASERQDAGDPKLQMLEQMASASFDHPLSKVLVLQVVLSSSESSNSADRANAQGSSNLQHIERKYLADLCQSFAQLTRPQVRVTEPWLVQVLLTLEGVLVLRNLSAASPPGSDLHSYVASLEALLEASKCDDALFDLFRMAQGQCARLGAALGVVEGSMTREQRLQSVDLPTANIMNREILTLAAKAQSVVNFLDADSCVRLMTLMSQPLGTKIGLLRPFLVAAVVLHVDSSMLSTSAELTECLDKIASLTSAEELGSSTQLALCVENGKLVLDRHSGVVNQATIDTLLSEICQLLSSSQQQHDPVESCLSSEAIFNRICGLLGSIMSRFRRRLSDRHHLLLPVLQGLLRCLFFPGAAAARSQQASSGDYAASFLHTLPFWVRSSEQPLPASAATKFSRLLSSICNPTVSAAKSSRKRHHNELHDETKRVKALAGQHMQYLVMEYARCSLDGVIEAEVKEKLIPGMYTVLDAMSRDVMRGMNAAMDASSRAIFKGLYDDWTRYGKWDKS